MQSDKFNLEFSNLEQEIKSKLNKIKLNECDSPKLQLDETLEEFKKLKDLLDLNGSDLPQYVRKVSQEKINQLLQSINEAKNVIQPKKTFKFNNAVRPIKPAIQRKTVAISTNDELDSDQQLDSLFGLKDKIDDENLKLEADQVNGKDIQLRNLINCSVLIYGNPSTVHIINCKKSRISIGPVSTSVFIDQCTDNVFQIFCQQLRVHNTYDCLIYLHVCTRGIIEDSSRLKFGRYEFNYDQLEQDIVNSKLNRSINNWNKIEDFNWLVNNQQSPNWQLLE